MNKYLKKAENSSGIDHYVRVPGTGAKQKITFTKMHGCANDYVYIDCFQNDIQNYAELAIYLSDRHTGIGGDGVIYICPSDVADARMRMYNLDGSEGMMCGNGIRCVAKVCLRQRHREERRFAYRDKKAASKSAACMSKTAKLPLSRSIWAKRSSCPRRSRSISRVILPSKRRSPSLTKNTKSPAFPWQPHCVIFGKDPDTIDLEKIGPHFEHFEKFPERINTEFIEVLDNHTLKMRVWERGSGENHGVRHRRVRLPSRRVSTATAKGEDITVKLRGGDLVYQLYR